MKNEFKEILRKKREERGESQGSLATAVGCSLKTVYRWELGERFPDGISLSRLASHFNCTTDELLGRSSSVEEAVGANLRMIREARGMRVKDIAEALGIAEATYYRYESGDRELVASGIIRLANVLGCSPNDILLGEGSFIQEGIDGECAEDAPEINPLEMELEEYLIRALRCHDQCEYSIFPACVELYKHLSMKKGVKTWPD